MVRTWVKSKPIPAVSGNHVQDHSKGKQTHMALPFITLIMADIKVKMPKH